MAHVSHRLRNSFEGAAAGGGDPASSPLYVFGPFLRLIVVAGVARITFGASIWLVVLTVAVVSAMYREVIGWVTDGTGGSGLTEEEFGEWAVKVNAGITFVEYTLTFLVSVAALVTLIADRFPALNDHFHWLSVRDLVAVIFSLLIGWAVNRGPKVAARTFGPATIGVLALLWCMILATIWRLGFHLPALHLAAFEPRYLHFTLDGFSQLLALMTGIEVFANLVAAYEGPSQVRSRKAFRSLLIVMGTTCLTMLIVGPAILKLSDPVRSRVSVFTQTLNHLLPGPLSYLGTFIGVVVLASASAASAQGLQNLALGLRYRHYVPARMGQRNFFDVADMPVWIEVGIACFCFLFLGTGDETYLSLYAIGVFVLLSMTGWAAAKRTLRLHRNHFTPAVILGFTGTILAALLTTGATVIIFKERFTQGAWAYFIFIPVLYLWFSMVRKRLGSPVALSDHLGRLYSGQYLLPFQREGGAHHDVIFEDILVPLDGSAASERSIPVAAAFCRALNCRLSLIRVDEGPGKADTQTSRPSPESYLRQAADELEKSGIQVEYAVEHGQPDRAIVSMAQDIGADLVVMTARERSRLETLFVQPVATQTLHKSRSPILLMRPPEQREGVPSTLSNPPTEFRRLLICLDGSHVAEQTLSYARQFAQAFQSEVLLLGVPESDTEKIELEQYIEKVASALRDQNLNARAITTGSGPARTIAEVGDSENADLIVLSKSGRGGSHRHSSIGSVASRVLQLTRRPVLLIDSVDTSTHKFS